MGGGGEGCRRVCGEVQEGVGCGEVQGCWVWGGAGVLGVGRCRGVGCGEVQGCWVWGGAGVLGVGRCRGVGCGEVQGVLV